MKFSRVLLSAAVALTGWIISGGQTRFKVEKDDNVWWFTSRTGTRFLSLGIDGVNTGTPFRDYDPAKETYAAFKFFPNSSAWAAESTKQLLSWNFNTAGVDSDFNVLSLVQPSGFYYSPLLDLTAGQKLEDLDLWAPAIRKHFAKLSKFGIIGENERQFVLGYFSDHHLNWSEGAIFNAVWNSEPHSGQRTQAVAILKRCYPNWESLQKDFVVTGAKSFADLSTLGKLTLQPGSRGIKVVKAYLSAFARQYYSLCRAAIKAEDPGALFLGDRYGSDVSPEIASCAGESVDVISTDIFPDWPDTSFAHFYMPDLSAVAAKPILVTCSSDLPIDKESSALEGASGERFLAKYLVSQPYVVGAHLVRFLNDSATGKLGCIDAANRPQPSQTGILAGLEPMPLHTSGTPSAVDATVGIPNAPDNVADLGQWLRNRGYISPSVDSKRSDLYASFSADGLYLALYWYEDPSDAFLYSSQRIPGQDDPQIHVRIGKKLITASVPSSGASILTGEVRMVKVIRGARNEAILKILPGCFGVKSISNGQSVDLDVGFTTVARAYFARWKGTFRLGLG